MPGYLSDGIIVGLHTIHNTSCGRNTVSASGVKYLSSRITLTNRAE